MRKARSVAWFSTAGFHQRSKCTTCEAAVSVSPEPPAFSDSTKNGTRSSSWKRLDQRLALADRGVAAERKARAAEDARELVAERRDDLGELGEDEQLLLPAGDGRGDLGEPRELAAVLARPAPPPPRPCAA